MPVKARDTLSSFNPSGVKTLKATNDIVARGVVTGRLLFSG